MALTRDELRAAALRHIRMEHDIDLAHIMDTVADNPVWLIDPVYRIEGRVAVEELYRRTLPAPGHKELSVEALQALLDPDITSWGEDFFIMEYDRFPDRYPKHKGLTLVVQFEGDRVLSERVYLTDPEAKAKVRAFQGPDFAALPGVTLL